MGTGCQYGYGMSVLVGITVLLVSIGGNHCITSHIGGNHCITSHIGGNTAVLP